jgi:serine phosphatase RsbU (regulator of sigma subunit)
MTSGGESGVGVDDLAIAIATCDSTQALYARLEELLKRIHALPAIIYVRSGELLRPARGFDCSSDVPPLPVSSLPRDTGNGELPANQVPLTMKGEVVGMLAVFGRVAADSSSLQRACIILGAKLKHLQQEEALRRELHVVNEQVAHLVAAGQLLRHLEIEVLLVKILEAVLGSVRAPAGAVLVRDTAPASERIATWGMREKLVLGLRWKDGSRFVDRAFAADGPVYLGRDEIRSSLSLEGALPLPHLGSLLALPLSARGRNQGLVLLGGSHELSAPQRRMAETLAGFAALALDNAMLVRAMVDSERLTQELSIARAVQEGMYPTAGLALGSVRVEGSSRPTNETGGDYFTFLERDGGIIAMIGDVSGHGLGAALFTTMAHAIVQHQLRSGAAIDAASRAVNDGLCHAQSGRFMTSALVAIDPRTRTFSYVSAGHCPLLWIHRGEPRWLDSNGMPLGIAGDNELVASPSYTLEPGDCLLLYTDGFTEALNAAGEAFGDQRLAAAALTGWRMELGPSELMMLVNSEVDAWSQGRTHEDDLTMVVIGVARS